jgi:hypothetical protein
MMQLDTISETLEFCFELTRLIVRDDFVTKPR